LSRALELPEQQGLAKRCELRQLAVRCNRGTLERRSPTRLVGAVLDLPSSASSALFLRLSHQIRPNPAIEKILALPIGTRRPQSTINNSQLAAAKPLAQPGRQFFTPNHT
jgi:hypothetical protein